MSSDHSFHHQWKGPERKGLPLRLFPHCENASLAFSVWTVWWELATQQAQQAPRKGKSPQGRHHWEDEAVLLVEGKPISQLPNRHQAGILLLLTGVAPTPLSVFPFCHRKRASLLSQNTSGNHLENTSGNHLEQDGFHEVVETSKFSFLLPYIYSFHRRRVRAAFAPCPDSISWLASPCCCPNHLLAARCQYLLS